ncbi:MAG: gamma-glutamyltransferase [Hasllibacter sp.]
MRLALPLLVLAAPLWAQEAADAVAPEGATEAPAAFAGLSEAAAASLAAKAAGEAVTARDWMIAAANPLAVEAGARVLREGGTAADAMVAVQAVLGLVEPQSSGLGGGAFLVWYDGATGEVTTLDGRETAPLAATPRLFQDEAGEPLGFWDAVVGGRSVGTPGTPMLMEEAHGRWGTAEWAGLFDEAVALAEGGFAVSPRLAESIEGQIESGRLQRDPVAAAYFFPGGEALAAGDMLVNPDYAETVRAIAEGGAAAFYEGEIAADIVAAVEGADWNPGLLSETDLAIYRVVERPPVCVAYRAHEVCGMGPPSSGALTVGQILGMLENFALEDPADPLEWLLIGEASRLAFADRGLYMADSDYVPVPTAGLVDPAYLEGRAALIGEDAVLPEVAPGTPEWDHAMLWAPDASLELPSTSHISIVDGFGNALSMTTTIENGFGSRVMVRGFLLNNELTDFSFRSHEDGRPVANRVEPGKRPRSSMAPTVVLGPDGGLAAVVGSPGGSRIIGYVAQAVIAHLDWGMGPQEAVAMPHAVNRFGTYDLEEGTAAAGLEEALQGFGYETNARGLNSGLHMIVVGEDGTLSGGADPRREGIALGE